MMPNCNNCPPVKPPVKTAQCSPGNLPNVCTVCGSKTPQLKLVIVAPPREYQQHGMPPRINLMACEGCHFWVANSGEVNAQVSRMAMQRYVEGN
jgi:hypothetical protein